MAKPKTSRLPPCSFCGKTEGEGPKVIAGPDGIAICAECVQLCVENVSSEPPAPDRVAETTYSMTSHDMS